MCVREIHKSCKHDIGVAMCPGCTRLMLLGRTGRTLSDGHPLHDSMITLRKCDAASAEEVCITGG